MAISTQDEHWMHAAIEAARAGMTAGQSPFGCAIVQTGAQGAALVAAVHNQVWATGDPTAHAEVNAIRAASAKLSAIALSGCTLYTTCEPCPMCMAAIHWARVERVVYGATIADAASAGFHELHLAAADVIRLGSSPVQLEGGCLTAACRALFTAWLGSGSAHPY